MIDIEEAPSLSFNNRGKITNKTICGCYFCLDVFEGNDIEEWVNGGETALCPTCGIDSVLPNESDVGDLASAFERWFTEVSDENGTNSY